MTDPDLYARAERLGFPEVKLTHFKKLPGTQLAWWNFCNAPKHADHAEVERKLGEMEA